MRRYRYVGSDDHKVETCAADIPEGIALITSDRATRGSLTANFIVDIHERLWIADRASEHIAGARGQDVLAAGEMTFGMRGHVPALSRHQMTNIVKEGWFFCSVCGSELPALWNFG